MIHVVLGTKAELIKMAPIMLELQKRGISYNFICTGQHRDTMESLQENFDLKEPDVVLHRGKDIISVAAMAVWFLRVLFMALFQRQKIFRDHRKVEGIVLVHGDTVSTLLGALMAKFAGLKVGHVESGLRSFRIFHPFPEELTRMLTFCLADIYFCPGAWPLGNVQGFAGEKVDTGFNTLLDSLRYALASPKPSKIIIPDEKFCVVTTHRFENLYTRKNLERTLQLIELAARKMKAIFVMHPITESKLSAFGLLERVQSNPRIEIRPRMNYFDFIRLLDKCEYLVTDGGSNQEECFYLGKPCLLLRNATERTEGLNHNAVVSKFEPTLVEHFVANYTEFAKAPQLDAVFPAAIVVDKLHQFSEYLAKTPHSKHVVPSRPAASLSLRAPARNEFLSSKIDP